MVYLDNAATTQVDKKAAEAMLPYFTEVYGNPSSLHSSAEKARIALNNARKIIADKINASPDEIIFTSGGTESDNIAILGTAYALNSLCKEKAQKGLKQTKNHIITTKIEHPAVRETCKYLAKHGFKITYLDVDAYGFIDIEQLKRSITEETILMSIIHGNNEIGTVQDIESIGKICRENKIIFHTDAVQSFCKVPIDVDEMNIDLMSICAHKIHGPKGIGALYIRKGISLEKTNFGGHQEKNIRAGTHNVPGAVGFGKAVELFIDTDIKIMVQYRDMLIEELIKIPNTRLNGFWEKGEYEKRLCNNVNISFEFIEGESMLMQLDNEGIEVSTGSACTSASLEPSHVLLAIGLAHEIAHGSIRFTLGRFTAKEDILKAVEKVNIVVDKLRKISALSK